jgi:hypothetical protein
MNPEIAARLLKRILDDFYASGGRVQIEDVSRHASSFQEWVLRHVAASLLGVAEQYAAADSRPKALRVSLRHAFHYSEWTSGGATFIRIQVAADAGGEIRLAVDATMSGTHCGVRTGGATIYGTVGSGGAVSTSSRPHAVRRGQPARPHHSASPLRPGTIQRHYR